VLDSLRAAFEEPGLVTVGLEEELMLLDAETLDLAPHAADAIAGLDGRFKLEMPAAQLEIVTAPHPTVAAAAEELARSRADLAAAVEGRFRLAGAGAHPFASGSGPLNPGPRYEAIGAEYASVARRQLVFGLHVHVAIRGADRVDLFTGHGEFSERVAGGMKQKGALYFLLKKEPASEPTPLTD